MLTLIPMWPEVGAQTSTARTGVPAKYTGSLGPGTFVITAVALPENTSTMRRSTGFGRKPGHAQHPV